MKNIYLIALLFQSGIISMQLSETEKQLDLEKDRFLLCHFAEGNRGKVTELLNKGANTNECKIEFKPDKSPTSYFALK